MFIQYFSTEIEFRLCPNYENFNCSLEDDCIDIFGTKDVSRQKLFNIIDFIGRSFIISDNKIMLSLMDIQVDTNNAKKLSVNSIVIKIIHILLFPHTTNSTNDYQVHDCSNKSAVNTNESSSIPPGNESTTNENKDSDKRFDILFPAHAFKTDDYIFSSTVSPPIFGEETKISQCRSLKKTNVDNWISVYTTYPISVLALLQPQGFVVKVNKNSRIYAVYNFNGLMPHVNSRKLFGDRIDLMLKTMTSERPEIMVNSTLIDFHGYKIEKLTTRNVNKKFDLWLESPINNPKETEFADSKFVADTLTTDDLEKMIHSFSSMEADSLFSNKIMISDLKTKYGDRITASLLLLNFISLLCVKYNNFKTYEDYQSFFDFMNNRLKNVNTSSMPLPQTMRHPRNVIHIVRCLFRYYFGEIGIMLPEGQCRTYSFLLASTRVHSYNKYLFNNFTAEDSTPKPNLGYLGSTISCKYILHPENSLRNETYPYKEVIQVYKDISLDAATQANQSAQSNHQEFILEYFTSTYVNAENEDMIFPFELRDTFPDEIKSIFQKKIDQDVEDIKKKKKKEKTKQEKVAVNFFETMHDSWTKGKMRLFFENVIKEETKQYQFLQAYRKKIQTSLETKKLPCSSDALVEEMINKLLPNLYNNIYDFNIVQSMAIYVGLVPYKHPNFPASNWALETLWQLIKSNGIREDPTFDNTTHTISLFDCTEQELTRRKPDEYAVVEMHYMVSSMKVNLSGTYSFQSIYPYVLVLFSHIFISNHLFFLGSVLNGTYT